MAENHRQGPARLPRKRTRSRRMSAIRRPSRVHARPLAMLALLAAALGSATGCGSDQTASLTVPGARVVDLPGAQGAVDFDDIVYSRRLRRVLVPAHRSGLYLVDPDSGTPTRV